MAQTLPSIPATRPKPSKLMPLRDAVREFVRDGDSVFLGYTSWATAFEWEIARQRKRDLTMLGIMGSVLLPLAGCSKRFITAYLLGARSPWFMERFEAGEFEVEDYSNQTMALMFMAGAMGLPFIPTKSMLGTDYLADSYYPQPNGFLGKDKFRVMRSPFGDERVVALPPLRPDVSCIHVQWADEEGNAVFWGGHGEVKWGLWASKRILISAEEIVPAGVIRSDPHRTVVPGFMVDAVVHLPFGVLPYGLPGYYRSSPDLQGELHFGARTEEGFREIMERWIDGCADHAAVLARYKERFGGEEALEKLRSNRLWEPARPIQYGWKSAE